MYIYKVIRKDNYLGCPNTILYFLKVLYYTQNSLALLEDYFYYQLHHYSICQVFVVARCCAKWLIYMISYKPH